MNKPTYADYVGRMSEVADFRYSAGVLQWDQETYMPVKGEGPRARQIATLTETAHARFTDAAFGDLLRALSGLDDLKDSERRNVVLTFEDYEREKKLPSEFVRRLSEISSQAFQAWIAARRADDFGVLAPLLDQLVTLKKEEAERKGYTVHPYDALLRDYEKGTSVARLDELFGALIPALTPLLGAIGSVAQVDNSFLHGEFPKQRQWDWGLDLLKRMGLDFQAARQDLSEHPFTTNFAATDVRITTRINEHDFSSMTWSCIHEGGHALYEQGLPADQYGLPLGEACSLSIHESQSRFWENNLGRSLPFWVELWDVLTSYFDFRGIDPAGFYKGINRVQPSLIRTEADELTYHFHVFIRYELEKALLTGNLSVRDIPAWWNEAYRRHLGLIVPDDRHGCLQDVHWSHGSFGYFPTYTLGSLYAAQLAKACPPGDFASVLAWLREKVHRFGRYYDSEDLCKEATGAPLDPQIFLKYLTDKYRDIYGLRGI